MDGGGVLGGGLIHCIPERVPAPPGADVPTPSYHECAGPPPRKGGTGGGVGIQGVGAHTAIFHSVRHGDLL